MLLCSRRLRQAAVTAAIFVAVLASFTIAERKDPDLLLQTEWDRPGEPFASQSAPEILYRVHNNGRYWNTVNNNGIIGNYFDFPDPVRYAKAPNFYYPRHRRARHGYWAGLWVGGVIRYDTLVSCAISEDTWSWWYRYPMEFWPDYSVQDAFVAKSSEPTSPFYDPTAKAPLEYTAVYTDTFRFNWNADYNPYDQRYHRPLGLRVKQTSYSWGSTYAEDFIVFDYTIENIGRDTIQDAYIGLYWVVCVNNSGEVPFPPSDDIAGYLETYPYEYEELGDEWVQIAWVSDNDGKANNLPWDWVRTDNVTAVAPLRLPLGTKHTNFNWFTYSYVYPGSWGPRLKGTLEQPLRHFEGELGYPYGDRNKYYLMAKPEIDYSGYETALPQLGWLPPPDEAEQLVSGYLPRVVISFGPTDMKPGDIRYLTLVMMIGEGFHTYQSAYYDLFRPYNPYPFINQLAWDDLMVNYRWAKAIYDNPGVDTDLDGDSGEYILEIDPVTGDSLQLFYEGDGIPDFAGPVPPPPPEVRVITDRGKIVVRWNGRDVESFFDRFTGIHDFEGYRVYISRSQDALSDYSLLASYDRENFNRYKYNNKRRRFELREPPLTLDSLKALYGSDFEPLRYTIVDPLYHAGGRYYFTKVDGNVSDLANAAGIHKVYPDAPLDTTDVDEMGRMRYYEYQYVIKDLLPTPSYWVSVTAFDFGYPAKSLESMESNPTRNAVIAFAAPQGDDRVLKNGKLNAYVYPNPYRIDGGYENMGLENRGGDVWIERARSIYFANLPNRCRVHIYSLDGDLIRTLIHDQPEGSGISSVAVWDLINRNMQMVTAGLYYWVVESDYGNQVGKLVIIR